MKLLIKELQLNGKMLLACAWTTKEESRRFKMCPWVSTWDVVEGLNSEPRLFYGFKHRPQSCEKCSHQHVFAFVSKLDVLLGVQSSFSCIARKENLLKSVFERFRPSCKRVHSICQQSTQRLNTILLVSSGHTKDLSHPKKEFLYRYTSSA